jgi:hypothetical protein
MDIFFFTSEVIEAVRGQKSSSECQKSMKEWIFEKKVLLKKFNDLKNH